MSAKEKNRLRAQIKSAHVILPHDAGKFKGNWNAKDWSDKDIENGFILKHFVSNRIYKYIRAKCWFPIPSLSSIAMAQQERVN